MLYAWECERASREIKVREDLATGRLVRALVDWCAPFAGYHLYDHRRRQLTPAFPLLVDALRYRGGRSRRAGRSA